MSAIEVIVITGVFAVLIVLPLVIILDTIKDTLKEFTEWFKEFVICYRRQCDKKVKK